MLGERGGIAIAARPTRRDSGLIASLACHCMLIFNHTGFLKWSAKELAKKSGVGWATIQRMEGQEGVPNVLVQNVEKTQAALEAAGVEFLPDGAVKLKKIE
jgi:hypothetical protein